MDCSPAQGVLTIAYSPLVFKACTGFMDKQAYIFSNRGKTPEWCKGMTDPLMRNSPKPFEEWKEAGQTKSCGGLFWMTTYKCGHIGGYFDSSIIRS
jgi:hypothetical protein